MRYAKLSSTEFYSCYVQKCHSIDLFSYRTPGHGQNDHMNKVCPSFCSEVFLELALFFLELNMELRAMWGCVWERQTFRKSCFTPKMEKIGHLGKVLFLRYGPKCSWPIRLQNLSINCRTLKLAVSHKEINEINWFLVCPSNGFLKNPSQKSKPRSNRESKIIRNNQDLTDQNQEKSIKNA